jgi:hypothetical protein
MFSGTQNSSDKPANYSRLNSKQQKAWRKNTRKMERNEEARTKYPPFEAATNIDIIHVHYRTPINIINELIIKARTTKRYVVDTESDKRKRTNKGGLIQIQFIHSMDQSTIILIEANYLPEAHSTPFERIKELCSIIFDNNNEIISWGPINEEFNNFHHLGLIHLGKMKPYNLQFLFSGWQKDPTTHPEMESRDHITGHTANMYDLPGEIRYMIDEDDEIHTDDIFDDYDDDDYPVVKSQPGWSLQKAVGETLGKFMDKTLTVNYWQCGLDWSLNTWKDWLFSQHRYDEQTEKQQRLKMKQYAINDCTAVAELFFYMYPDKMNDYREPDPPTTTSTITMINPQNELSDISDDELPETFFPRFNRITTTSSLEINQQIVPSFIPPNNEQNELIVQATAEEIQEIISPEEQRQRKAERQRKKNEKFKWKKQNLPHFNNKIRRPIYFKYDYMKIRAQLAADKIYTSHQITINKEYGEVRIGFTSDEELQRAKKIMKINYFSKEQFIQRWGEIETNNDKQINKNKYNNSKINNSKNNDNNNRINNNKNNNNNRTRKPIY